MDGVAAAELGTTDAGTPTSPVDAPGVSSPVDALSDRERAILVFERGWWKYAGVKEQAVRSEFGLSSTRYYQILNTLIDRDAALAYDPLLVKRLRRLRASRRRARTVRRLDADA